MKAFGQPDRTSACACERQTAPTLIQALELLNGSTAYSDARGAAAYYAKLSDDALIEELYLTALSRRPIDRENITVRDFLKRSKDRNEAITDVVWTLVNTREFLLQH